jgi:hypothetical protein
MTVCPTCGAELVHHPDDLADVMYHPDPRLTGTPCEWFTEQLAGGHDA